MRVRVNPVALASMGIGLEDVRTAIANANAVGPVGDFDGNERAITIGTNDAARTVPQYERSSCAAPTAPWCGCRRSPRFRAGRAQQPLRRLVQQPAIGAAGHHQAGRRQRASTRWTASTSCCRSSSAGYPRPIEISVAVGPHPDHPRQRARHAAHAARHHRAGDAGGVPVPAARGGDHRRRRHRAAGAGRHLRARCGSPASPSTTSR